MKSCDAARRQSFAELSEASALYTFDAAYRATV